MTKAELRKIFLTRQKGLSRLERCEKTERVIEKLFQEIDVSGRSSVSCFVTLEKNNELDTSEIFRKIRREFPEFTICAPRVNFESSALENVVCSPAAKFVKNKWQILEPDGDELIDANRLDAVFVPLLAFDERGHRVGYGKGFYDKLLSRCRIDCLKIGLSLFPPVKAIADVESWDVRLDACVTPEQTWNFKRL